MTVRVALHLRAGDPFPRYVDTVKGRERVTVVRTACGRIVGLGAVTLAPDRVQCPDCSPAGGAR